MINTHRRQKLLVSAMVGMTIISGNVIEAKATEELPEQELSVPVAAIEDVLEQHFDTDIYENVDAYLVQTNEGEYLNRAFSNVMDFTYIRTAPDEESDWLGKLYSDSAANIIGYSGEWTKIQSGTVEGYVKSDALYTGEEAQKRAAEYLEIEATVTADVLNVREGQGTDCRILTQILENQIYQVTGDAVAGWYPVQAGDIAGWVCGEYVDISESYSYAESKAEEEERLAEEAKKRAEEEARKQAAEEAAAAVKRIEYEMPQGTGGQAVIDFACQFIGNPYVWGGTSLTDGADCSGFVQSVYAHFGISLPRTTWDMETVGYEVSYDQAQPGDLVLYDGHVGLYMGDGNIVNAMNENDGIGICTATYAPIITIRRVL